MERETNFARLCVLLEAERWHQVGKVKIYGNKLNLPHEYAHTLHGGRFMEVDVEKGGSIRVSVKREYIRGVGFLDVANHGPCTVAVCLSANFDVDVFGNKAYSHRREWLGEVAPHGVMRVTRKQIESWFEQQDSYEDRSSDLACCSVAIGVQ